MEYCNCGHDLAAGAERCPRCGQRFQSRGSRPQPVSKLSLMERFSQLFGGKG